MRYIWRKGQRNLPGTVMNPSLLLIPCILIIVDGSVSRSSRQMSRSSRQTMDQSIDSRPTFRHTPRNITVSPGERAVLKCRVDHLGTKTVTWKKRDQIHPLTIGHIPFAPDTRISVDYSQRSNEWSLVIQDVRPMDDGTYQCQISTKSEHDTYDIRLNVKNIQVSGDEYVEQGGRIQLICNATGKPEPPRDVEWFKGGQRIQSDAKNRIIITKKIETKLLISVLVIQNSRLTDAGNYTCRSSNQDTCTITVHVLNASTNLEKLTPFRDRSSGLILPSRKNYSPSRISLSYYPAVFVMLNCVTAILITR